MEKEQFLAYWNSYLDGTATSAEVKQLLDFIRTSEADAFLEEYFHTKGVTGFRSADLSDTDWQQNWSSIQAAIHPEETPVLHLPRRRFAAWLRWSAAAMLAGIAAGAFFLYRSDSATTITSADTKHALDLPPGKDGAVLTLADGRQIVLDTMKNGVIGAQDNMAISLSNGQVAYRQKNTPSSNPSTEVFNTITTPGGRQFRLLLPDGSRVWLNASSSIRYPVQFTGRKRKVEITGEAYFEVQGSSSKPFEVYGDGQQIEVLGTAFNVNLYKNEPIKKTTLVSGAVKVSAGESATVQLKPGQEAVLEGVSLKVQPATGGATDWKDNVFNFHHARLPEVMRQIERWYDIEVKYSNGIPDVQFWGKIGRDMNLSQMIAFLERSDVHCRLEAGNTLVVLNSKK